MDKLKFYIAALPYEKGDAGRMYLHKLAWHLNQLGEDVTVVVDNGNTHPEWGLKAINSKWHELQISKHNSVGIYPEICSTGNPFYSELCIRWVLGTPGGNHGDYSKNDLAYLWREGVTIPDMSLVKGFLEMTNLEENLIFKNKNRHILGTTCYMIRKGHHRDSFDFHPKDALCIDDFAQKGDKEYLKEVFNHYEYFICYDDVSFIPVQAALCGCIPIVIPRDPNDGYLNSYGPANTKRNGIAYGLNQIQWAKDTLHLVSEDLQKQEEETISQVKKLISDSYDWFKNK